MQARAEEQEKEAKGPRLFIGIRLDARSQHFLDGLVDYCKRQLTSGNRNRVRWTSHANRHLTLAFLGETSAAQIPLIEEKLLHIADQQAACAGRIVSLHPFPQRRSRLLAAEMLTNPALDRLHQHCRQLMIDLGMKPESSAYRPHITLGRSRRSFAHFEPLELDFTLQLDNMVLYQSLAAPGGSQYHPLLEAQLASKAHK